jgi:hypothetical protein
MWYLDILEVKAAIRFTDSLGLPIQVPRTYSGPESETEMD